MTVTYIVAAVIAVVYALAFIIARAAGRADEALRRLWEEDEPLRRRPGGGWRA